MPMDKNYMMEETGVKYGYMDGEYLPWGDCKVHMYSHVARYGFRTFEGIKAYWNKEKQELYVFRLQDHLERLVQSNKLMRIQIPYTVKDMTEIIVELLRKNDLRKDSYVQPSGYIGMGGLMATSPEAVFMGLMIPALPSASTEGKDFAKKVCISSWRRITDKSTPPRIKVGCNYLNSWFSRIEAQAGGYDSVLFLNDQGKVSEGAGTNLFMIRKGVPYTPPVTADILEGITRDTLKELLKEELGLTTIERDIDRTELCVSDEVFLCGTGSEIIPISHIDGLAVGNGGIGQITRKVRDIYFGCVRGKNPKYMKWLTPVFNGAKAA
ncbi:MAG: branched-chain amino acid transaminase [Chloroflexi bacterium]|nr:branched-chain amino acid transaminase [Chloroflexota bacterium]